MGKNNKPILSILIDEDKRDKFKAYADSRNISMGQLVNEFIDRLLAGEIEVEVRDKRTVSIGQSIGNKEASSIDNPIDNSSIEMTKEDIEELVKTSIENLHDSIEESAKKSIEESNLQWKQVEKKWIEVERKWANISNEQLEKLWGEVDRLKNEIEQMKSQTSTSSDPIPTPLDVTAAKTKGKESEIEVCHWREFHQRFGLDHGKTRSAALAERPLAEAAKRGEEGWHYNKAAKNFWRVRKDR